MLLEKELQFRLLINERSSLYNSGDAWFNTVIDYQTFVKKIPASSLHMRLIEDSENDKDTLSCTVDNIYIIPYKKSSKEWWYEYEIPNPPEGLEHTLHMVVHQPKQKESLIVYQNMDQQNFSDLGSSIGKPDSELTSIFVVTEGSVFSFKGPNHRFHRIECKEDEVVTLSQIRPLDKSDFGGVTRICIEEKILFSGDLKIHREEIPSGYETSLLRVRDIYRNNIELVKTVPRE